MGKRVVVISTSIRANSNSEMLAKAFAEGAESVGNDVCFITLKDKQMAFCKGCLACQSIGKCVIEDDVPDIMEKVLAADVVVWATPIYYYEMSGQMKTLIDRLNPMFAKDYHFREIYLLSVAAEDGEHVPEKALFGLQGWIDCFGKATLKGSLFCGGVDNGGAISGNPKLKEVFEMGASV